MGIICLYSQALGADFMIHYGHSCLVPIDTTGLPTMYVFVEIGIDVAHLVASIRANFPADGGYRRLALAGTVQFTAAVHAARTQLLEQDGGYAAILVPQAKPLSPGEVLGCTSPQFSAAGGDAPDAVVFVADGRFHLESIMIHNPLLAAFKYDPYSKKLTSEAYDTPQMLAIRRAAVETARAAVKFGLILGTLGRQGSAHIMQRLEELLHSTGRSFTVVCLSEITPAKLARFDASVECWIQVACPRLSTDWGYAFARPLLTPYEAMVALGHTEWRDVYPMDYYASDGGDWTNYAHKRKK